MLRVGLLLLGFLLAGSAIAQDPIRPGWPPCQGGEVGFWSPHVYQGEGFLAVLTHDGDYLNPATIICWVKPSQAITVVPVERG